MEATTSAPEMAAAVEQGAKAAKKKEKPPPREVEKKPKLSKAERRELQDTQRAAKAACKVPAGALLSPFYSAARQCSARIVSGRAVMLRELALLNLFLVSIGGASHGRRGRRFWSGRRRRNRRSEQASR
jgi:hypothetical protein